MLIQNPPAQIADHLWMLGTGAYPLYLFRGDGEAAIFEGGTGAMGPLVRQQMETLGIPQGLVKQLIIPHAHPDHVMAVPLLREMFPGVSVLASQAAKNTLAAEKAISVFRKLDDALTDSLIRAGMITEQHRPQVLAEKQIAVDRVVQEGDTVTVDGTSFSVLQTPGHSDCSLSFHQPESRLLLVSDAAPYYLHKDHYWWPNYFTGYDAYLASMERLAGLNAEVLCLGHHAVVRGADHVEAFLQEALEATRRYHRHIVDAAKAGKAVRQIAEQLGAEIYEKVPLFPLDFFQKNCGLLVKLSLRHEGIPGDK